MTGEPTDEVGRIRRLRERALELKTGSVAWVDAQREKHASVDFVLTAGDRDRILGGSLVSGAIAFRLFLALVPMMVVVVAIIGLMTNVGHYTTQQLVSRMGMVGYIADSVADASKISTGTSWTVLVVAAFVLFLTTRSLARAMRTAHALAWGLPIRRWPNGTKAALVTIGFLVALLVIVGLINTMRRDSGLAIIGVAVLTGVAVGGLWLVASRFLPRRSNRWLALLPGAVLVGVGTQLINVLVIYFTWRAARAQAFYGSLGTAIVLLAWLYIMGRLLIASAVLNSHFYVRRTGDHAQATVLAAEEDAVAGVDAGARLEVGGTAVAAARDAGTAVVTVAAAGTSAARAAGEDAGDAVATLAAAGQQPATMEGSGKGKKPQRGRRIWAMALVVLAAIISVVMMVSVWAHDFLLDTDKFVATVTPVLKDPQVTRSMGELVAERAVELTDLETRLKNVLPARLDFIAAPIAGRAEGLLAKGTTRLLRSEKGYKAWETILRFSHRSIVALLTDRSKFLKIYDDEVRLDLLPLVVAAVARLESLLPDVIATRAPLPEFSADQSPEQQRAELAEALGMPVRDDFAQITLFEGDQVKTAQQALRLFDLLAYGLIALTAILVIAAILVSPRRLHTLMHIGVAAALAVVVTRVAINQTQDTVLASAAQTEALPVIRAGVSSVFGSLQDLIVWGLVAGAVVGVIAYIATGPRWLWLLGRRLAQWTKAAGRRGKAAGAQAAQYRDPVFEWVRTHRDPLIVGVAVVVAALLLFLASSLGAAVAIIAIGGALAGGVYWIGRTPPPVGTPSQDSAADTGAAGRSGKQEPGR